MKQTLGAGTDSNDPVTLSDVRRAGNRRGNGVTPYPEWRNLSVDEIQKRKAIAEEAGLSGLW